MSKYTGYGIAAKYDSPPFNWYPLTKEELDILLEIESPDGILYWQDVAKLDESLLNKIRPQVKSVIQGEIWVTIDDKHYQ
jgi:hypothetical protein